MDCAKKDPRPSAGAPGVGRRCARGEQEQHQGSHDTNRGGTSSYIDDVGVDRGGRGRGTLSEHGTAMGSRDIIGGGGAARAVVFTDRDDTGEPSSRQMETARTKPPSDASVVG
jgi:hypothetical protein